MRTNAMDLVLSSVAFKRRSVPRPTDLKFSTIQDSYGGDFEALYSIYSRALPARERKSRDALISMMSRPGYAFSVARSGDRILGFSIVFISSSVEMALLEYMAVDEQMRSSGIGTALFQHARHQASGVNGSKPILIEVDSDRAEIAEHNVSARRKIFYRRLGCREIQGLRYVMPLAGSGPPPAMELLVCGLEGSTISTYRLREWLQAIYTEVYGCSAGDVRIQRMLSGKGHSFTIS